MSRFSELLKPVLDAVSALKQRKGELLRTVKDGSEAESVESEQALRALEGEAAELGAAIEGLTGQLDEADTTIAGMDAFGIDHGIQWAKLLRKVPTERRETFLAATDGELCPDDFETFAAEPGMLDLVMEAMSLKVRPFQRLFHERSPE
jgi:hypothetical protein